MCVRLHWCNLRCTSQYIDALMHGREDGVPSKMHVYALARVHALFGLVVAALVRCCPCLVYCARMHN